MSKYDDKEHAQQVAADCACESALRLIRLVTLEAPKVVLEAELRLLHSRVEEAIAARSST